MTSEDYRLWAGCVQGMSTTPGERYSGRFQASLTRDDGTEMVYCFIFSVGSSVGSGVSGGAG